MNKIIKQIESLDTSVCGGLQGVEGIGIGAPGPVDTELGIMIMASNLPGFENYPICHKLKEKFGLPTFIDNDANVAGLAEAILGAGKYKKDCLTDYLQQISEKCEFKKWYFGHYHDYLENDGFIMLYEDIVEFE